MDIQKLKPIYIILAINFFVVFLFVFSTPLRIWDETVYLNLGYDLATKGEYNFNNGWSDYVPGSKEVVEYNWPNAGFRAPLLPVTIAFFFLIGLGNLAIFIVPIFSTLTVLSIYILSKKLFRSENSAILSAIFSFVPIFIYYSSKTLTDAFVCFFVTLSFLFFWDGYENSKTKSKIIFGVVFALAVLARYTSLWLILIFFSWILFSKKFFILKFKETYYSLISFFIVLIPHFIYSYNTYGNIFGSFLHGFSASKYWGGTQSVFFYLEYWLPMFSIIGVLFIFILLKTLVERKRISKETTILLFWVFGFIIIASLMPHKEDRFILPILPAIAIICGDFIGGLKNKKFWTIIIIIVLSLSLVYKYYDEYSSSHTDKNLCFTQSLEFVKNSNVSQVYSDESTILYYYTKNKSPFYRETLARENNTLFIFSSYDMGEKTDRNMYIKSELDSRFNKVFSCEQGEDFTYVYAG